MTTQWDVIVVGGGLAGLAAGATAATEGATTLVLEAHRPGGRAKVAERQGFLFNHGAHALYAGGEGMAVLRALGVRPSGSRPPLERYRLLHDGQLHVLPTGPATLLRTRAVGRRGKVQLARVLAGLPLLDADDVAGTSVAEWLAERALRPDAERVMRVLVRLSTYCADLEALSADAAIAQIQLASRAGVLYLDGGWDQLTTGLARQVPLRTGAPVGALEDAGPTGFVVDTGEERLLARSVVVATGGPDAVRAVLPAAPSWPGLTPPATVACLDAGVRTVPRPGYVLGADEPLYATTQSPPARQAPEGCAVVGVTRYGARGATEDRADCEAHLRLAGVRDEDVVTSRFLARMVVMGTVPAPPWGGRRGRPSVGDTGTAGLFMAGDWVGPDGLLADTALASGRAAALAALRHLSRSATMVA